ncbi:MAG: hypothetical protein BWK80_10420 [Desulfobacteraceae bacterium IS3]|nr:MAG: hypothetical protein BWK80_10420 [Desulfobacteraceae bacterium IS3]
MPKLKKQTLQAATPSLSTRLFSPTPADFHRLIPSFKTIKAVPVKIFMRQEIYLIHSLIDTRSSLGIILMLLLF